MLEVATFAGGCFWCTEAIFKRIKGVVSVTPGYSGGEFTNPNYGMVSTGKTGYAECIQIEFDPKILSFERLLDIFWAMHDPTTLNRQGSDQGTQYRSAIFYHNQKQKQQALISKEKIEKSGALKANIVTQLVAFDKFYAAEQYHRNYYERDRGSNPYCSLVIDPKIEKLLEKFNQDIKVEFKTI